jgi:hypothetical protein
MFLYALVLNPLHTLLDTHLRGIHTGPRRHKFTSVVYADDVTVILTAMAAVEILDRMIRKYERATGARINWEKSQALPVGAWDVSRPILTVPYATEVKILGLFGATVENSVHSTWTAVKNTTNSSARHLYLMNLCYTSVRR